MKSFPRLAALPIATTALLLCAFAPGPASAPPTPPLLEVATAQTIVNFKQFCLDTGGRTHEVIAAASVAGLGLSEKAQDVYADDDDHPRIAVTAFSVRDYRPALGPITAQTCTVTQYPGQAGDAQALAAWLGAKPQPQPHAAAGDAHRLATYYFTESHRARTVIPASDRPRLAAALKTGTLRAVRLDILPGHASRMIYEILEPDAPAPKGAYSALAQLKTLCLANAAEPAAVRKAALAAGYRPDAAEPKQLTLGDGVANAVSLRIDQATLDKAPEGPAQARLCVLLVFPGAPRDIYEIQQYFGVPSPNVAAAALAVADDGKSRRILAPDDLAGRRQALAAGTLRSIKAEPGDDGGVMVIYAVERPLAR